MRALSLPPVRPSGTGVPELEEGPGLVVSAWRHKWLIALLTVLGIAAGLGASQLQPVMYEGVARVLPPPSLTVQEGLAVDPIRSLQNQATIMSSTPVLAAAAKRYGRETTADLLRKRVEVSASQEADVLTVRALDPTPEGAARLANAVVQAYQEVVAQQSRQDADARVTSLRKQRETLAARLDQIRESLAADPNDPALLTEQQAVGSQYQSLVTQEYQLQEAAAQAGIAGLVEAAEVPRTPEQPKPLLLMAGGALAALFGSILLAWLLETARARRAAAGAAWGDARRAGVTRLDPAVPRASAIELPVPGRDAPAVPPMLTAPPPTARRAAAARNGLEAAAGGLPDHRGDPAAGRPSDPEPTTELPELPAHVNLPALRSPRGRGAGAESVGPADGPSRKWPGRAGARPVVGGEQEPTGLGIGMDGLVAGAGGGAGGVDRGGVGERGERGGPSGEVAGGREPAAAGGDQLREAAEVAGENGEAGGEGFERDHGLPLVPDGRDGEGAGAEHVPPQLGGAEAAGDGDARQGAALKVRAERPVPGDDEPE